MEWTKDFPRNPGFYWWSALHANGPNWVFVREGESEQAVKERLRQEYPHAEDFSWGSHDPNPVTDQATTWLLLNVKPGQRMRVERRLDAVAISPIHFIEITGPDGEVKSFGNE